MGATIAEIMNGNWQFVFFFSKFKGDNSADMILVYSEKVGNENLKVRCMGVTRPSGAIEYNVAKFCIQAPKLHQDKLYF